MYSQTLAEGSAPMVIITTTDQLEAVIKKAVSGIRLKDGDRDDAPQSGKNYLYGTQEVMNFFHVSAGTAHKYIHGILAPAVVSNYGRKVIIDADKAMKLLQEAKED